MSDSKSGGSSSPAKGTLGGDSYEAEDIFENAEPWDPIETKLVVGSLSAAVILLIIFGFLINTYILN